MSLKIKPIYIHSMKVTSLALVVLMILNLVFVIFADIIWAPIGGVLIPSCVGKSNYLTDPGKIKTIYPDGEYRLSHGGCDTFSMYPVINCNDLLVSRKVENLSDLRKNDIISFKISRDQSDEKRIVHRIMTIDYESNIIKTKGDNNRDCDDFNVTMNMTIWKVIDILPTGIDPIN